MSELIENIDVTVDDAPVATVPLVDNFTADNAAPKASAVGTALASKVDASAVMEHVTITVDGQESDNQGVILLYGDDIPIDDTTDAPSVKDAIDAVDMKTAADIAYGLNVSVKDKIDDVADDVATVAGNMRGDLIPVDGTAGAQSISAAVSAAASRTASDISYASGVSVAAKIGTMDTAIATAQTAANNAVKVTSQTLTDGEKVQARTNIGALGASDVADVVRTSEQTLTTAQQAQARANIGVVADTPASEIVGLDSGLSATFTKCGKICSMYISGQLAAGAAQWASIGTIPAAYIPYADFMAANLASFDGYFIIHPSGTIQAGYALATNAWVIVNLTYICV